MGDLDNVLKEFLVESYENLDQLDRDFVDLEKNPGDRPRLASIFRTIHTIKGTCGFFGFSKLEKVSHVGENLLSKLRDGVLVLDPERTSALLAMVDAVRAMLAQIEQSGNDGDGDYTNLINTLTRLTEETEAPKEAPSVAEKTEVPQAAPVPAAPTPAVPQTAAIPPVASVPGTPEAAHPPADNHPHPPNAEGKPGVSENNIRVDVGLLDKLMNLVGELVLARNQILQFNATQKDPAFLSTTQRLNLITTELQEGVMKTRMQPIGNIWNRFPRVVRDLAVTCGKQIRLEMEGKETELDRTILEAIKDPLTHIVRNSVDHGIESPEKRNAANKNPEGCLRLRAYHEGGQVNIEITDDGGGIDGERVKNKAIEKGLITRDQGARLSERELVNLIFLPGFSTAEKITNVSGRGVGMDVVKTNIEKIGGTVDIQSRYGEGTTLKIKIPLTLAIIPALVVTCGGDRYAIPQVSLLELVRLEGEQAERGIERIHGAPVYRLRGNLLPLVYLAKELNLDEEERQGVARPDFKAEKRQHLAWKNQLRSLLDGERREEQGFLSTNEECELGAWMARLRGNKYGRLPDIINLKKAREDLHAAYARCQEQYESGQREQAEKTFSQLCTRIQEMMILLNGLEQQLEERTAINIVVLQADDRHFGLVVDTINDTEEIVVKPLGKHFKAIPLFAGATIMGDGRVALILDVLGIAQQASVISEVRDRGLSDKSGRNQDSRYTIQTMLVFGMGDERRMAIPLSLVARLEEIPLSDVERADGQEVVQYRGQIMPLVRMSGYFGGFLGEMEQDPLQVVVYTENGRSVGLVVGRILDIVEVAVEVKRGSRGHGLMGSAVIQGHVTDLVDLRAIVHSADPMAMESVG